MKRQAATSAGWRDSIVQISAPTEVTSKIQGHQRILSLICYTTIETYCGPGDVLCLEKRTEVSTIPEKPPRKGGVGNQINK